MYHAALIAAADLLAAEPDLADCAPGIRRAAALAPTRETALRWSYWLDGARRCEHDPDLWTALDTAGRALERALEADGQEALEQRRAG